MTTKSNEHAKLWELNPAWDLLTTGEKAYVESESEYVSYHKNEIIHHEGDTPTHMMTLISGKIRLYKEGVGMKPQIIRMLKPYDFFGYRAVIAGDEYNSCASAFETSLVCRVNREAFLEIVQQNNRFCFRMMEEMAKDLAISELRTVNLTQKHIRGRLAESLLSLKQSYGLDEDEVTIAIYISREDLANMSSMTTSNAIRTLSQFAQEGIISLDGKKIKLLKEDELIKISQMG
ncbi:MAG: Crp/Fnr family transcriptional regulator [Paludibacteraceae bacterium]|nr:Crp/Fnr family transcriptional regulator [Paludibacteraceae bacterium]